MLRFPLSEASRSLSRTNHSGTVRGTLIVWRIFLGTFWSSAHLNLQIEHEGLPMADVEMNITVQYLAKRVTTYHLRLPSVWVGAAVLVMLMSKGSSKFVLSNYVNVFNIFQKVASHVVVVHFVKGCAFYEQPDWRELTILWKAVSLP